MLFNYLPPLYGTLSPFPIDNLLRPLSLHEWQAIFHGPREPPGSDAKRPIRLSISAIDGLTDGSDFRALGFVRAEMNEWIVHSAPLWSAFALQHFPFPVFTAQMHQIVLKSQKLDCAVQTNMWWRRVLCRVAPRASDHVRFGSLNPTFFSMSKIFDKFLLYLISLYSLPKKITLRIQSI